MTGEKNNNSGESEAVAGENVVSSEQPSDGVEEKERDGVAEGAGEQEGNAREKEDEEKIEEGEGEEEVADAEKPKLAEGFYEIETIRRKRIRKGKAQYLIKWRGWPESANTWEPVENLMTCYDVIDAYEESLQSGKQRSTRKRKRKQGVTHTQIKRKQQKQHSPADGTSDVPAVEVRIIEEPVSSPPLASLNATDHVDSNGSGLNNNNVDEVANGNDLMLDFSEKEVEEQNESGLKLSELKGAMATKETSVDSNGNGLNNNNVDEVGNGNDLMLDSSEKEVGEQNELGVTLSELKGTMATKETSVDRSGNGFPSGFSTANETESLQSGRHTGAKRRKPAVVRRFKQVTTSGVVNNPQDAVARGPLVAFMQEEIHDHGCVGNAFGCNNKCDNSKDAYVITEIIKPMSYSASITSNDVQDVFVAFLVKRSDGTEVMVDNKFLKTNNPLLLINFYEKHLRYHPTE
ncbi:chromo domain protein LHP1-like [Lycium barbarum]|uniref:chromo domain protein LHP1-like n=1 Tax=Lycium barbarum TaxID=112863 RepID=UPI00293EDB74|nr:chromo domain protein LHP1-like [Lycium barbarum]